MIKKIGAVAIGVFAIVAVTSGEGFAQSKCSGGKIKNAGKKAGAKLNCLSKGLSKGLGTDSTCLAKAEVKFSQSYAKAEAKVPNDCITTSDATAIEAKIDTLVQDIDDLNDPNPPNLSACDSAKVKAAGKKAAAKLTCHSKAVTKALGVDSTCLAKAEVKFSQAVAKADAKAVAKSLPCSAGGTEIAYETLVDDAVDDIVTELTTAAPCADCCSSGYTTLTFTNSVGAGTCGTVVDAGGVAATGTEIPAGDLDCSGLYFGGAGVNVPLPTVVPDLSKSVTKITACGAGNMTLGATSIAEAGGVRNCTSSGVANGYPRTGCLFGPPLPVPNANTSAVSTCVVNRIVAGATGTANCSGSAAISFNLGSDLYLTGDFLPGEAGINPCPLCIGAGPNCVGGPNNGLACTPGSSDLGVETPTSHDCPPPEANFIGTLPIPFALTTGTATLTASDKDNPIATGGDQTEVFCGFCRATVAPFAFQGSAGSPSPCSNNAGCGDPMFPACRQRTEGAFSAGLAHTITLTGTPAPCLSDGQPHGPSTLVSAFCIPPSYNGLVDSAADLAGPGAVSLPGTAQLQ